MIAPGCCDGLRSCEEMKRLNGGESNLETMAFRR